MLASEVLQVTVLSVASSGFTVAVSVSDSPSFRFSSVLFRVTSVTAMTFLLTVTLQVADLSPDLAVIVAEPSFAAVTLPLASAVAILASEVLQVTVLSVASSGFTVAVSVSDSPSFNDISVLFSVTDSTGIGSTVTSQEALLPLQLAWMVDAPTATAVILPLSSTVTAAG